MFKSWLCPWPLNNLAQVPPLLWIFLPEKMNKQVTWVPSGSKILWVSFIHSFIHSISNWVSFKYHLSARNTKLSKGQSHYISLVWEHIRWVESHGHIGQWSWVLNAGGTQKQKCLILWESCEKLSNGGNIWAGLWTVSRSLPGRAGLALGLIAS